jgi:hypothetical protein
MSLYAGLTGRGAPSSSVSRMRSANGSAFFTFGLS